MQVNPTNEGPSGSPSSPPSSNDDDDTTTITEDLNPLIIAALQPGNNGKTGPRVSFAALPGPPSPRSKPPDHHHSGHSIRVSFATVAPPHHKQEEHQEERSDDHDNDDGGCGTDSATATVAINLKSSSAKQPWSQCCCLVKDMIKAYKKTFHVPYIPAMGFARDYTKVSILIESVDAASVVVT